MSPLKPVPFPDQFVIAGRWCRLEPLSPEHAPDLFAAVGGDEALFDWLSAYPPHDEAELAGWISRARRRPDRLYSAVIDAKTKCCVGRQALMRIRPEHAAVELGDILWGEGASRTRVATEAVFLTARHLFEQQSYRRLEWTCDARNEAARRAALRFGFIYEGLLRQDMIVKGRSRDTVCFSMLDSEWPALKPAYEAWLDPKNFDRKGMQQTMLATSRGAA